MEWKIKAILSKNTFNNIGEKHIINLIDLPVVLSMIKRRKEGKTIQHVQTHT